MEGQVIRNLQNIIAILILLCTIILSGFIRSPFIAAIRGELLYVLYILPALLALRALYQTRQMRLTERPSRITRNLILLTLSLVPLSTGLLMYKQGRYHRLRTRVLSHPPARLAAWAPHIMVGYRDPAEIRRILEIGGAGGIYITARNLEAKELEEDARQIAVLKEIYSRVRKTRRLKNGGALPGEIPGEIPGETVSEIELRVAADQEGGIVNHLSPPLKRQTALGKLLSRKGPDAKEDRALTGAERAQVQAYAREQADGLRRLGVNLNFAPVLDLPPGMGPEQNRDGITRISERAVSSHPGRAGEIALLYCRELIAANISPTLKHFPGLGRVAQDTHTLPRVELDTSPAELRAHDWAPYRRVVAGLNPEGAVSELLIMVAHITMTAVDPELPLSYSPTGLALLRRELNFEGILVSDDFSMAPVVYGPLGVGGAAVKALQSGLDIVLIAYDPDLYYEVMDALLRAEDRGEISPRGRALRRSSRRLAGLPVSSLSPESSR